MDAEIKVKNYLVHCDKKHTLFTIFLFAKYFVTCYNYIINKL